MLCPKCHAQYGPETTECPVDGTRCLLAVADALGQGPTSVSQAVKIALAALETLEERARAGMPPAPIGPDTVCFTYDEGVVRVTFAPESRRPIPPAYVAPELRPNAPPPGSGTAASESASALHAIGILIHHAVTGRAPPADQPLALLAQDDLQDVPETLDHLLASMTADQPGDRPTIAHARQTLEALELDSTILGNRLMHAVREASVVPQRQIVFGPDVSNVDAGFAETLIRDNHDFARASREPQVSGELGMGADTTLIRTHSSVDLAPIRGAGRSGAVRWWLVAGALVLGALLGFAAVRWTAGM